MELRLTTWKSYRIQADAHIIPAIGQLNIQELRPDHLQKLYSDIRLGPAFIVLMATGLRRGELLGLRWRNIDFDNKFLTVEENLVWTNKAAVYQPPKTEKSQGRVPLIKPIIHH